MKVEENGLQFTDSCLSHGMGPYIRDVIAVLHYYVLFEACNQSTNQSINTCRNIDRYRSLEVFKKIHYKVTQSSIYSLGIDDSFVKSFRNTRVSVVSSCTG